jgi:hypothetical protein
MKIMWIGEDSSSIDELRRLEATENSVCSEESLECGKYRGSGC